MASTQLALLGALSVLFSVGCAPRAEAVQGSGVSALAGQKDAQRDLRSVRARYFALPRKERGTLSPELRRLMALYPEDPGTAWLRCYLAFNLLDAGERSEGRRLAQQVKNSTSGRISELATIALAAALTFEGRPQASLALLTPLEGKIVEGDERQLYYEEVIRAGVAAKRYAQTIQSAYDWITSGSLSTPDASYRAVAELISQLPTGTIQAALGRLGKSASPSAESREQHARAWFLKTLRQTLIKRAIAQKDPVLSRWLLGATTVRERLTDVSTELSRLATTGAPPKVRVIGRRLGLVLGAGDDRARDRSANVVAGVVSALDLTSEGGSAGVQLITESDDGTEGGTERALQALASEGVALLIAGVDPSSATAATHYAEKERLPVVLLDTPTDGLMSEYTFRLGAPQAEVVAKLSEAAFGAELSRTVWIGPGFSPCVGDPGASDGAGYPRQAWQAAKLQAIFLLGHEACTREVAALLAGFRPKPMVLLGLESSRLLQPLAGLAPVALGAGRFPESTEVGPWFQVLGHDAAVIGARALEAIPQVASSDDREEARRLHSLARRALASVDVELWSSEARGFQANGEIKRTLRLLKPVANAPRARNAPELP